MPPATASRRRTLLLFPALLALPATGAVRAQQPTTTPTAAIEYREAFDRAMDAYAGSRWAVAEPLFADLVERTPGDGLLWFRLARIRHRLDRPAAAIDAYRATLDRGYRYRAWISYQIARLYAGLGESDSTIAWLDRSLAARYEDRPGIAADPAFESLRGDPRFRRITGEPAPGLSRDEGWRHDLAYLVEEAKRMHADPDRPAFSAAFDSAAAALHARIPHLSNDRILVELERLVVRLGDGHSGIYGPDPDSPARFEAGSLPVLFYQFDDGLYIIDAIGDARRWIGSRVLRFGPRPAEDVLRRLSDDVHQDNAMTVKWLGVRFRLRGLAFLHATGATDDPARATLTLRDRDGRKQRVTLRGGDHLRSFRRKLRPPPNAETRPPLYLRDVDRNYWLQPLPDHAAVYFQFNQVRDMEEGPSIAMFADSLRHALERTAADNLVVDVRHNNGGNNSLVRPLVRTMVWWEEAGAGRRIFLVTGRNTFSAAQNFINRVERLTDAVFVGEPSSSRPNFAGEETNLLLPWSRVRGSISTRYWQDSDPGDERQWIAPRIPVTLSADDYFANRDPVMATLLRVIERAAS